MPEPLHKPALNWKRERRFAEAVKKVENEQWSQARAAAWFGVSRPRLNEHVRRWREGREAREQTALRQSGPDLEGFRAPALGVNERRRVGTFEEFDERYFGRWVCPDCERHHETPQFHKDIAGALRDPETRRLLINLPPYHSKSTNVTVKDTVYDIVLNPNLRTLIVSKSDTFASTFLHSIDQLLCNPDMYMGGPSLIDDWGPFKEDGQTWNRKQIYVAGRTSAEKDPTVQTLGVGGQIYGRRADKIKFDDIATLGNQRNPAMVMQMLEWIDKECLNRIGRNRGLVAWAGTRVNPGDIYHTLGKRTGYKVMRYPAILDETGELTLWPDHFPYEAAVLQRAEMRDADFQLVYQNVDVPGLGASFTQEMLEAGKDTSRVTGMYEPGWRLIAGLDLAGGNKDSGYTAGVLKAVDLRTGKRFYVDCFNTKSMRAPQLKDQIFDWCDRYPIYEWRVENNGLQSQLVQYNQEIVVELAKKGIRIVPHNTQNNKWDPEFGVESMAPLWQNELVSVPWGNSISAQKWQMLIDQLVVFPMGLQSDLVMADWFSDIGCRDLLRRAHLPMFDSRMNVPERIRRKRVVVDFNAGEVKRVPLHEQSHTRLPFSPGLRGYRRVVTGRPQAHDVPEEMLPPEQREYANVAGSVPQD